MGYKRFSAIGDPEFLNVTSISPLISKCEIKVFYLGLNRNKSYITKEVATDLANTLPGSPIVGYFMKDKQDFDDHGDRIYFDEAGMHEECMTKPYGFVAPGAKIWFQKFQEVDSKGEAVVREYLMTEGYLWTGQYEECKAAIENGKGQSMEFDPKHCNGNWAVDKNNGTKFFIINDTLFYKLCLLGDDVEPCFEGAAVTAPDISKNFSNEDTMVYTLFQMMEELKTTLSDRGGEPMNLENNSTLETQVVEENITEVVEENVAEVVETENTIVDNSVEETVIENQETTEQFAKKEDEEKEEDKDSNSESNSNSDDNKKEDKEDKDEDKKKYELLESENASLKSENENLKAQFSALEQICEELKAFKNQVENAQKDELIASFYMLSDDDKQDVIENKSKYSLDDIESKLSVICFRKKINFAKVDEENNEEENAILTYNLNGGDGDLTPAWLKAVEAKRKSNN